MPTIEEVVANQNKFGEAVVALRAANEEALAEAKKAGGAVDFLTKEKIDKINDAIDAIQDAKNRIDAHETVLSRGPIAGTDAKETPEEAEYKKAYSAYARKGDVQAIKTAMEKKALSVGSDPDGGYLVPQEISSSIIKIVFETSPLRQVASVQTIGTNSLDIPEDRGESSAAWVGETTAATETTTGQVGMKNIPVHLLRAYPKLTQTLLDDAKWNMENWLADQISDQFSRKENTAFINGSGVLQPRGILTYAAGTSWGTIQQVASGSSGAFDADDLITLFYTLKSEYAKNATFLMNRSIERAVRLLKENTTNQYIWQPGLQAGQPNLLLSAPVLQCSDMPDAAADSLSIAIGDFRRAYTIVDRFGIRVIRDEITAPGFIKLNHFKRVGGDVTNYEAIKLMKLGS